MLTNGARLGPSEIVAPLGAGGMGEVYRARDTRLGRDVAIKVLPVSFAADPDRLRRFEQEARAAGQLNHPNILAVYDVGSHEGTPYLVEELLEGQTLRRAMDGAALPPRKAIDYAGQIARGLAAAHDKGVVHRDLKPDNVFVTHDGRVKILDFGLAKLMHPEGSESALTQAPTAAETGPGVVLGTVGYMSPEQVRGRPADNRSDLFSLGALLYEMLSGRRAFAADSSVETMNAILKDEPPLLSQTGVAIGPDLERIVQHCLEKNPAERFQSARDLAFQLESMSGAGGAFTGSLAAGSVTSAAGLRPRDDRAKTRWVAASIVGAILVASVAGFVAGRSGRTEPVQPRYRPLTFRSGSIFSARFAADGSTVVYAAAWDDEAKDLYVTRTDSPGSRPLQIPNAEILSISPSGEMALLLDRRFTLGWMRTGRLARVPIAGGIPREIIDGVHDADWAPDGENLAIARTLPTEYRLEYPVGNVLYSTTGWISDVRISPDGERVAFVDHPGLGDDKGRVAVVDRQGTKTNLSEIWSSAQGLAWSRSGAIYFTAGGETGNLRSLRSVDLAGNAAVIARAPVGTQLMDVSADGRFLVARLDARRGINGLGPGQTTEKNLSWLDWSFLDDLSEDGSTILFTEQGEGGGADYSTFVRSTDGSAAVRISSGQGYALSRDGKLALIARRDARNTLVIVPTGAGEERSIELPFDIAGAAWHPDGKRLVINGVEPGSGARAFLYEEGGTPRAITPPGAQWTAISPDGRLLTGAVGGQAPMIYPIDGGEPQPIPAVEKRDIVLGWSADGGSLLVARSNEKPLRVDRVDLKTGERTPWREIIPADQAGVLNIGPVLFARDGLSYAYSYRRVLSTLYLAEP